MFIRFFRSSFPVQYFTIGLIGLLLWGKSLMQPPPMPVPEGPVPLYDILYVFLHDLPRVAAVLGLMLVLAETWMLNVLFNNNELVLKNSSLASLVFIILISSSPLYLTLNPLSICIFLTVLILDGLMKSYNRVEDLDLVYGAGFIIAVGSLFYFPYLMMLAVLPVGFVLFRSSKWREWAAAFIGFATPYLFLAVYYFLTDKLPSRIRVYEKMLASFFFYPINLHIDDYVIGIFTIVLALWGFYYLLSGPMEKTSEIRAKTYLVIWTLPVAMLSIVYSTTLLVFHLIMLFPALTLMLTSAFLGMRKKRWAEIIFLIYFLLILANSYFYNPK